METVVFRIKLAKSVPCGNPKIAVTVFSYYSNSVARQTVRITGIGKVILKSMRLSIKFAQPVPSSHPKLPFRILTKSTYSSTTGESCIYAVGRVVCKTVSFSVPDVKSAVFSANVQFSIATLFNRKHTLSLILCSSDGSCR